MTRSRWLCAALTWLTVAAGCAGGGGSDATPPTTAAPGTSTTRPADPCDGVDLRETEIGVTDEKIVVEVVADVSGAGVGEQAHTALDAVKAWAKDVNRRGGLACRDVEVREWDSALSAVDTTEGTLDACKKAVAMVGTAASLVLDTTILSTCPDEGRAAVGLPDLAVRAVEVPHQCNPTTFAVVAAPGSCPYAGGPRQFDEMVGPLRYFASLLPSPHALMVSAGETPATALTSANWASAAQAAGLLQVDGDITATEHDRSGSATRALALAAVSGSTIVHNDAHRSVLAEMRSIDKSAATPSSIDVWACSAACYPRSFLHQDQVDGTYVWLPHLPFEEAATTPALEAYLAALDDRGAASSAGLAAWTAATTFEQIVERIVQREGHNGITRVRILDELEAIRDGSTTVPGLAVYGTEHVVGSVPRCFVVLRVRRGEFRRVHPAQPGTLDCSPENIFTVSLDPATAQIG